MNSAHAPHGSSLHGMRVLVVDDAPVNRQLIEWGLQKEGAWITGVPDASQAISAVRSALDHISFDVILMDLQMPLMDGYTCATQLRLLPGFQTPIVALTALTSPDAIARCYKVGMVRHLAKPIQMKLLVQTLREVCDWLPNGSNTMQGSRPTARPSCCPAKDPSRPLQPLPLQVFVCHLAAPDSQCVFTDVDEHIAVSAWEGTPSVFDPSLRRETLGYPIGYAVLACDAPSSADRASVRRMPLTGNSEVVWILLSDAPLTLDLHACVRAGFHDVLPRTLSGAWLGEFIRPHLGADGRLRPAGQYHVAAIASEREMRTMEASEDFFAMLLQTFVGETSKRRNAFLADWESQPKRIALHSHSLKGVARTLGMDRLAEVCAEIEEQCDTGTEASLDIRQWHRLECELLSAHYQAIRWMELPPMNITPA